MRNHGLIHLKHVLHKYKNIRNIIHSFTVIYYVPGSYTTTSFKLQNLIQGIGIIGVVIIISLLQIWKLKFKEAK